MGVPGTDLSGWRWLRGRCGRLEFWLWLLAFSLVSFRGAMTAAPLVQFLVSWAMLFVLIRRLHDIGLSGWWVVGMIVMQIAVYAVTSEPLLPAVTRTVAIPLPVLVFAVLGLAPGQRFTSRFGPPPAWPRPHAARA
jgi:uncharacterized membrane protein YhaH (DUF805 family)